MNMPRFVAEASLYKSARPYRQTSADSYASRGVVPQAGGGWACAVYAGLCLAASEDPPAAAWCWWDFAQRCAGALA